MCIRCRIPISYTISCSILIKSSISNSLIQYRGVKSIFDYQYRYRSKNLISKLQLGSHALIIVSTRLLWDPRAYYISKNKNTISNIIRYRTMNIRYQRRIINIGFVESISRGLNRYRIIKIVLYYQYCIVDRYQCLSIPFLTASGVTSGTLHYMISYMIS
jgi:hypothetical protein